MENYHINTLIKRYQDFDDLVKRDFINLNDSELNSKPNPEAWSILECLAHLNLYSEYYIPEIKKVMSKAAGSSAPEKIKWSWFGKMSVEKIAISNSQKMKTISRMNPANSDLDSSIVEEFLEFNAVLKTLSFDSKSLNYNKKGIRVEFLKILKLNLAETLVFMMEHQNRHLIQAQNVLNKIKSGNKEMLEH